MAYAQKHRFFFHQPWQPRGGSHWDNPVTQWTMQRCEWCLGRANLFGVWVLDVSTGCPEIQCWTTYVLDEKGSNNAVKYTVSRQSNIFLLVVYPYLIPLCPQCACFIFPCWLVQPLLDPLNPTHPHSNRPRMQLVSPWKPSKKTCMRRCVWLGRFNRSQTSSDSSDFGNLSIWRNASCTS
jgi:hypothetical protein